MTREMAIAVERAARAAQTDALVEALGAIGYMLKMWESLSSESANLMRREDLDNLARGAIKIRAVLAKYAPDREGGAE